ncbi:hypothetical protein Efla_001739 [Eimeria flavescens]
MSEAAALQQQQQANTHQRVEAISGAPLQAQTLHFEEAMHSPVSVGEKDVEEEAVGGHFGDPPADPHAHACSHASGMQHDAHPRGPTARVLAAHRGAAAAAKAEALRLLPAVLCRREAGAWPLAGGVVLLHAKRRSGCAQAASP